METGCTCKRPPDLPPCVPNNITVMIMVIIIIMILLIIRRRIVILMRISRELADEKAPNNYILVPPERKLPIIIY